MKQTSILFLLFILFTSCNQPNFYRESLLKELTETDADSGLLILLKDNEIAAQINLIKEDSIYKDGNEEVFHQPRNTRTLLTPILFMCILDSISPTDTVDVGNGIYIMNGTEIRDHNADRGGYGVLTAEQVLAFDSKIGFIKLMEKNEQTLETNFYKMGFSTLELSPLEIANFYNRIAHKDSSLCSPKVMEDIHRMLSKVITEGTGKNLYMEDIPIEGKTGNAENEVSCCAYFTLDNSVYTCLVIISNPKNGYPSGGMMAGNVIKGIVNQIKER